MEIKEILQQAEDFTQQDNYAEAAKLYQQAVEQGHAGAMRSLAGLYEVGLGVELDEQKALQLYVDSAEKGDPYAPESAANLMLASKEKEMDFKLLWRMLTLAFNNGSTDIQFAMEFFPLKYLREEAATGEPYACLVLGTRYLRGGKGLDLDIKQAYKLFLKSAEGGNAIAMRNVARMYSRGEGVSHDYEKAAEWYKKANEAGLDCTAELAEIQALQNNGKPSKGGCLTMLLTLVFLFCLSLYAVAADFNTWFYNKTMRFDYYHAGSAANDAIYFDEIIEEPYYAGSKVNLINNFGYGYYRFQIQDKATGTIIYQNNYNSLMQEWQTTPEAKSMQRAMPESIVFPYPRKPFTLTIQVRDNQNVFHTLYTQDIDPENYMIRKFSPSLQTMDISYHGNAEHCIDIVLIPEGYTEEEKAQFLIDCQNFTESLFHYAPYGDYQQHYNLRAVWAPSLQSGVSCPGEGIWKQTSCKVNYYTFYSERYQMTDDMQNLRNIAAHVPYDYIYIISNSQKYGGGAIYNWYGISAAHIKSRPESIRKTYAHEFGHLLLGLGDEYVGGSDTELYHPGIEPWEANLTALIDGKCKWETLIKEKTPLPTPLPKGYDINKAYDMNMWQLGAYEGGGYIDKGIFRPMPNCMMNWMHTQDQFCPVCDKAIREYTEFLIK